MVLLLNRPKSKSNQGGELTLDYFWKKHRTVLVMMIAPQVLLKFGIEKKKHNEIKKKKRDFLKAMP
jgi:hypothetical protein